MFVIFQPVISEKLNIFKRYFSIKKLFSWPSLTHYFLYVPSHCQIPGFCVGGAGIPGIEGKVNCDVIVGYKSVYRMCFAMACFFFLFSIIMIRVRSSKDPRAAIQNGFVLRTAASVPLSCVMTICCTLVAKHVDCTFSVVLYWRQKQTCVYLYFISVPLSFWFFKFLVLVGITVGAFFIPDGIFTTGIQQLKSNYLYSFFFKKKTNLFFDQRVCVLNENFYRTAYV